MNIYEKISCAIIKISALNTLYCINYILVKKNVRYSFFTYHYHKNSIYCILEILHSTNFRG